MRTTIILGISALLSMVFHASGQTTIVNKGVERFRQTFPLTCSWDAGVSQASTDYTSRSLNSTGDSIGLTRFDMQSPNCLSNRLVLFPDGTVSAVWVFGMQNSAFPDRGTGYNHFNGSAWLPMPGQRIEPVKTGYPCIQPFGTGGEAIVCHQSALPLMIMTRPVKGSGAWTTSEINLPSGAANLWYAHMITNGANHNNIHLIVATNSTYQGMLSALLYYRSTDGGVSWDKQAVILPGLDSTNYDAIYGDYGDWGTPHRDTIYFALGAP